MEDEDDSEADIVEDVFFSAPPNTHKFGKPGTRTAATEWFKSTQTFNVFDQQSGRFADWFHGIISRKDSECLLQGKLVGCYLIRVSESRFGYTLSFKDKERCRHYMIDQLNNGKFIVIGEAKVHRSLHELVQYHKKVKISNWDGFLTVPCGQDHGECDYVDLVSEQLYFVLEDADHQNGNACQQEPRKPNDLAPTLPLRQYRTDSRAQAQQENRLSGMEGRPLPKIPEEAYIKLIQNQQEQHKYRPLQEESKHKPGRGRQK